MQNKKLISVIIAVIVIAVLIYVGYVYYQNKKEKPAESTDLNIDKAVQKPLENMPSTNPFEGVKNPFRDVYKNPFE